MSSIIEEANLIKETNIDGGNSIIEDAEKVYNATVPGVLNRNTMEKEEVIVW